MEKLMSYSGLRQALGARLFTGEGKQAYESIGFSSVHIDSRDISPGGLFVALRGTVLDGHSFVEAAFKAGASGAMVASSALEDRGLDLSGICSRWNKVLIVVEDTLKALQDAARAYLKMFPRLIKIAIT